MDVVLVVIKLQILGKVLGQFYIFSQPHLAYRSLKYPILVELVLVYTQIAKSKVQLTLPVVMDRD